MAWNEYKNIRRKVGCHLRISCLPPRFLKVIPKGDEILVVKVDGRDAGRATLALWSYKPGKRRKMLAKDGFYRYTVTMLNVSEDPEWVVER